MFWGQENDVDGQSLVIPRENNMTWSWKGRQGPGHTEPCRSMIKTFRFTLRATESYWRDFNEGMLWSELYFQIIVLAGAWRIDSGGTEEQLGGPCGKVVVEQREMGIGGCTVN